jgi:hypothetical protein
VGVVARHRKLDTFGDEMTAAEYRWGREAHLLAEEAEI